MYSFQFLFLVLILPFISLSKTFIDPTLSFANATLPYARDGSSVVYDGEDAVYIIGGYNGTELCATDILKFTVSTETLVKVADTPKPACFGQAVWDPTTESIYHFSEDTETQLPNINSMVLRFNVNDLDVEEVGTVNGRGNAFTAVLDTNERVVFIIGGSSGAGNDSDKEILKYDLSTNSYLVVGQLPGTSLYSPLSISLINSLGMILVLGESTIYRFIPYSACGTSMEALNVNLPTNVIRGSVIYSTEVNLAYIVGGSDNGNYDILELNPLTLDARSIKLSEFPQGLVDAGSVYIQKLNSIYFFGGYTLSNGEYSNRIGILKF